MNLEVNKEEIEYILHIIKQWVQNMKSFMEMGGVSKKKMIKTASRQIVVLSRFIHKCEGLL